MNCPRRHTRWQSKRLYWEGALGRRTRVRKPRPALPHGSQAWILWCWGYFLGCLWTITLSQGPSWWCMHWSAKMDSREDSGRSVGHTDWHLLFAFDLSQVLLVDGRLLVPVPSQYLPFKVRDAVGTVVSDHYGVWPGWAVSTVVPLKHLPQFITWNEAQVLFQFWNLSLFFPSFFEIYLPYTILWSLS